MKLERVKDKEYSDEFRKNLLENWSVQKQVELRCVEEEWKIFKQGSLKYAGIVCGVK